ncbi:hypothetical protein D3C73_420330 [compost metagenome]
MRQRHEVDDLGTVARAEPAGQKDIAFRDIHLQATGALDLRCQFECAALFRIKQGGEDARAVKIRPAQVIDRAILGDERDRAHISDGAMLGDGAGDIDCVYDRFARIVFQMLQGRSFRVEHVNAGKEHRLHHWDAELCVKRQVTLLSRNEAYR